MGFQPIPEFMDKEVEQLLSKYETLHDLYDGDENWLNQGTMYLEGSDLEKANWFYANIELFEYTWVVRR